MKENAAIKDSDAETRIKNMQYLRALYLVYVKEQLSKGEVKSLLQNRN
jgi:hypothetical protein